MKDTIKKILREGFFDEVSYDYLYHATSDNNLENILKNGFSGISYWTNNERMSEYYADVVTEDEGGDWLIFKVPMSRFDPNLFEVDHNAIAEPITLVLGATDDELYEQWEACDGTWKDSLDIYNSVRYKGHIKVTEEDIDL